MPNIIELGINVDSFSEQKMARLNEFIALFNKLSEYDGKVYNPILGSGLAEFNSLLVTTGKLLDEINAKITQMSAADKISSDSTILFKQQLDKLVSTISQQQKEIAALKLNLSDLSKSIIAGKSDIDKSTVSNESNSRSVKSLISDYQILKATLRDQSNTYANLHLNLGANAPETKEALSNYATTAGVIGDIDKKLESAQPKAFGIGKGLSSMYNQLRIIAYILPGIGIAGIFNLAFDAIEKAADALDLFNDKSTKAIDLNTKENEGLTDQIALLEKLIKLENDYHEAYEFELTNGGKNISPTFQQEQKNIEVNKSLGTNPDEILSEELKNANERYSNALFNIGKKPGEGSGINSIISARKSESENYLKILRDEKDKVSKLTDELNKTQREKTFLGIGVDKDIKLAESNLKSEKSVFDYFSSAYNQSLQVLKEYYDAKHLLDTKNAEQEKQIADERRKRIFENTKDDISLSNDIFNKTLSKEDSTLIQRQEALKGLYEQQLKNNRNILLNVTSNNTSTDNEKQIAEYNKIINDKRAELDYQIKLNKLNEDYRQKRLEAQKDIDKSGLDTSAINNERIYQNEKKSLSERLDAYAKYVSDKQKIQDLKYKRDIDVLSLKAYNTNPKTGEKTLDPTVQKQIEALQSERDAQKSNEQANVQKQVYDIVFSSLQKQLKAIIEEDQAEDLEAEKKYTKQLNDLNKSYNDKKISYEHYRNELSKIEKGYNIESAKDKVEDDQNDLEKLEAELERLKKLKSEYDKNLDTATVGSKLADEGVGDKMSSQKSLDTATGEEDAVNDSIDKVNNKIIEGKKKLQKDENNLAKAGISTKEKDEKKWYEYAIKVERELYKDIKSFADASYEYKLDLLEKQKAIIDEQYGYEIAAIERSSLSAKDKAALQIQLSEQKIEYDKKVQAEEKVEKIKQAEFDKKLSIMHIILDTAEAVMAAKPPSPAAITAGIVGGIELGVAVATPIPSFAKGVTGFEGGLARYGEDGSEILKVPHKAPRLITTETISYLPKGTDIVPIKDDVLLKEKPVSDGWEQTIWLAKQIKRNSSKQPKVVNNNFIKIDLGFEKYKKQVLGN